MGRMREMIISQNDTNSHKAKWLEAERELIARGEIPLHQLLSRNFIVKPSANYMPMNIGEPNPREDDAISMFPTLG